MSKLTYKRILLKVSGEVLMGNQAFGIDLDTVARVADEVIACVKAGAQVALVIGGGNIFRGLAGAAKGMDRVSADHMGIMATVMNALAMQGVLKSKGIDARVLSAIAMPTVCETYSPAKGIHHLEQGRVVICAAGTGLPFFTTDTGAALRAAELQCDALLKGTSVDGVYSADPKNEPEGPALRPDHLQRDPEPGSAHHGPGRHRPCAGQRDSGSCIFHPQARRRLEVLNGTGRFTIVTKD